MEPVDREVGAVSTTAVGVGSAGPAPENPGSKVVSGAAGDGGVDENAAASPASIGRRGSDAEPDAHPVVSGCA